MKQVDIGELLAAYHAAGRALDKGMRRVEGATAAEWQAEEDARAKLHAGRRTYVEAIREAIQESQDYQQRVSIKS